MPFSTILLQFHSVQLLSCVRLFCDPMDCNTAGFPVHHQLPELAQTHVHWVGDAIQPSYPLSSPSPPAFNLCQHQGLSQWVSSLHQVAKILEFQLQASVLPNEYSGLSSFRMDWLILSFLRTLKSPPTPQFKSINSSALSLLYGPTLIFVHYWKNHSFDHMDLWWQSNVSGF